MIAPVVTGISFFVLLAISPAVGSSLDLTAKEIARVKGYRESAALSLLVSTRINLSETHFIRATFEVTLETVDEESPAAVEAANAAGAAHAANDIAAGTLQILRYGLAPPELPGPFRYYDEETGYPIYDLNNCMPTAALIEHVRAYNEAMRKWHAAHKK